MSAKESTSRRARFWWPLLAVSLLLVATPFFEAFTSDNERPRLLQAMAWVDAGETAIDGRAARGLRPGVDVSRAAFPGARLHPNKAPGGTVPAIVAYQLVTAFSDDPPLWRHFVWWSRFFGGWLPTLGIVGVAWLAWRERVAERWLNFALVTYLLATPVASYAGLLYGHQLAAFFLFTGTLWILRAGEGGKGGLHFFGGGLLCALAVTVEYGAVFVALPLAWLVWSEARRQRRPSIVLTAGAGAMVPIVPLAAYHAHAFGSPWSTPYHHVVNRDFAAIHGQGLLGLYWPQPAGLWEFFLSPWGSFLLWAPLCALAVGLASWRRWHRRAEPGDGWTRELGWSLAIFGVGLALNLALIQKGGWRVGPRYLVLYYPFAIAALIALAKWAEEGRVRVYLLLALGCYAVTANTLAADLFPYPMPWGNPVFDLFLPLWLRGNDPWGVALPGLRSIDTVLIGSLTLTVVTVVSLRWRDAEGDRNGERKPWGRVVIASLVGLLLLAALRAYPSAPTAESDFFRIEGIWEPGSLRPRKARVIGPMKAPR